MIFIGLAFVFLIGVAIGEWNVLSLVKNNDLHGYDCKKETCR